MIHHLSDHEIRWHYTLPDERLAALPLVSEHNSPQDSAQEYECGCVAVTRITDRDYRLGQRPFEMRLAVDCDSPTCERRFPPSDPLDEMIRAFNEGAEIEEAP